MDKSDKIRITLLSIGAFIMFTLIFFGLGLVLFSISENVTTSGQENLFQLVFESHVIVDAIVEGFVISSTFTTLITFYLIGKTWKQELDL